jgi:hypothetical protein
MAPSVALTISWLLEQLRQLETSQLAKGTAAQVKERTVGY